MRLRACLILLGVPLATVAFARRVDIYPKRAAVTLGQTLQLTALTGDPSGVSWSVSPDGGSVEPPVSHSGQAVIFTVARRPGIYTVTATTVSSRRQFNFGSGGVVLASLPDRQGCGPTVLRAYDAVTLHEIWSSPLSGPDAAGNAVKFTVPTIANGRVYIGTRGNNTGGTYGSTGISGELDVYGLKPR